MDRITKSMVQKAFELFVSTIGGQVARNYNDVDRYGLDYNGVYGGYLIYRIVNVHGGQTCPFGYTRKNVREMFDTLHFAMRVIHHSERQAHMAQKGA